MFGVAIIACSRWVYLYHAIDGDEPGVEIIIIKRLNIKLLKIKNELFLRGIRKIVTLAEVGDWSKIFCVMRSLKRESVGCVASAEDLI